MASASRMTDVGDAGADQKYSAGGEKTEKAPWDALLNMWSKAKELLNARVDLIRAKDTDLAERKQKLEHLRNDKAPAEAAVEKAIQSTDCTSVQADLETYLAGRKVVSEKTGAVDAYALETDRTKTYYERRISVLQKEYEDLMMHPTVGANILRRRLIDNVLIVRLRNLKEGDEFFRLLPNGPSDSAYEVCFERTRITRVHTPYSTTMSDMLLFYKTSEKTTTTTTSANASIEKHVLCNWTTFSNGWNASGVMITPINFGSCFPILPELGVEPTQLLMEAFFSNTDLQNLVAMFMYFCKRKKKTTACFRSTSYCTANQVTLQQTMTSKYGTNETTGEKETLWGALLTAFAKRNEMLRTHEALKLERDEDMAKRQQRLIEVRKEKELVEASLKTIRQSTNYASTKKDLHNYLDGQKLLVEKTANLKAYTIETEHVETFYESRLAILKTDCEDLVNNPTTGTAICRRRLIDNVLVGCLQNLQAGDEFFRFIKNEPNYELWFQRTRITKVETLMYTSDNIERILYYNAEPVLTTTATTGPKEESVLCDVAAFARGWNSQGKIVEPFDFGFCFPIIRDLEPDVMLSVLRAMLSLAIIRVV